MSEYPTAEEELKSMTKRFWAQLEVTEKVVKERDEAKSILETVRFHLRRNDHVTPSKVKPLLPSDTPPCPPRELATKIATRLFTTAFGDEGTRLEIKRSVRMTSGPEEEVSLGGWCLKAAVDQIERAILEKA